MISTEMLKRLHEIGYTPENVSAHQASRLMDLENLKDQQGVSKFLGKVSFFSILISIGLMFFSKLIFGVIGIFFSILIMLISFILHEKYMRKSIDSIMGE